MVQNRGPWPDSDLLSKLAKELNAGYAQGQRDNERITSALALTEPAEEVSLAPVHPIRPPLESSTWTLLKHLTHVMSWRYKMWKHGRRKCLKAGEY